MGRQPSERDERPAAQGSLRQLALDIPRLRTAPAGEPAGLASLRDKSQELTRYLDDLRAGHRDLDAAAMRVR